MAAYRGWGGGFGAIVCIATTTWHWGTMDALIFASAVLWGWVLCCCLVKQFLPKGGFTSRTTFHALRSGPTAPIPENTTPRTPCPPAGARSLCPARSC
jgi:hypothetical protein